MMTVEASTSLTKQELPLILLLKTGRCIPSHSYRQGHYALSAYKVIFTILGLISVLN